MITKLKVYYQELLTSSESITPLFIKKEAVVEMPLSTSPMCDFIEKTHKRGYWFLELGKPTLSHNILHVEQAHQHAPVNSPPQSA